MCIIYAGIHSVVFDEQCQHIVAMCSLEGEMVPLRNLVRISSLVEVKLLFCIYGLLVACIRYSVFKIEHVALIFEFLLPNLRVLYTVLLVHLFVAVPEVFSFFLGVAK